jgi:hypothetical protein
MLYDDPVPYTVDFPESLTLLSVYCQDAHVRQLAAHSSFLSCIPLFRGLSPAVLASVVYRLRPREVTAKGAVILEQGKPADGLYLVHAGDVIMSANAAREVRGPAGEPTEGSHGNRVWVGLDEGATCFKSTKKGERRVIH